MTANIVADAIALAEAGQPDRALPMLRTAADAGDVDALMQLGVWALAGRHMPRDPIGARNLIRRAVAIGHVDGALMEIALTANGTGGTPDWAHALELLCGAAAHDFVAAEQLTLVEQMALNSDGTPAQMPTPRVLNDAPRIAVYPALLTPAECGHIAAKTGEALAPAQVIDSASGRLMAHPVRTSHEAAISPAHEDLVVRAINLRIAAASATHVDQGEILTVLRYTPGQEYRPHLDTIAGAINQRVRTVLIYLNEAFSGGETYFPHLGLTITPKGGDAVVFDTLTADGRPDDRARHAGLPVKHGAKWLATRWIRAQPFDAWEADAR